MTIGLSHPKYLCESVSFFRGIISIFLYFNSFFDDIRVHRVQRRMISVDNF